MAYRRKRSYTRKRPTRKRSYPSRRSYSGKRRSTRPRMSRKRILNMTSTKKMDTMSNFTNYTLDNNGGTTLTATPTVIKGGGRVYGFLWCATARQGFTQNKLATKIDKGTRTSQTCYMRGLKENISIQTNTGAPWIWRRICFTAKGNYLDLAQNTASAPLYSLTTSGYLRVTTDWLGVDKQKQALLNPLFRGKEGTDWTNLFSATVDTERVNLKYDKTTTIRSGNNLGTVQTYKRWHPMNKNLIYDDDEEGGLETTANLSVKSKSGMGDYYVFDMIIAAGGSTTNDAMVWDPTSTLYWHEK